MSCYEAAPGDEDAPSPASSVGSASSSCSAVSSSSTEGSLAEASHSYSSSRRRRRGQPYESGRGSKRRWLRRPEEVVQLTPESVTLRPRDLYTPAWQNPAAEAEDIDLWNRGQHRPASETLLPPAFPAATHRQHFDTSMQTAFDAACVAADHPALDGILRSAGERIDVDLYGKDGRTALHRFCAQGQLALVRLLVAHGADTRLRTREGWSAVHLAAFAANGAGADTVAFLMRSGRR